MSQVESLYQLQQLELEIIQHRRRLKEIEQELGDNEAVQQAQTTFEEGYAKATKLQTQARDLELQIQSVQDKQKRTEERLYSGSVNNPKELQDMQQEIESLKNRHAQLEDQMLELMSDVEEATNAKEQAENALAEIKAQWETEHQDLVQEQADHQKQAEAGLTKRKQMVENIEPELFKLYDTLRQKKANRAISPLEGRSCSVCGIEQTTSIVQDARKGDQLVYCRNCRRILANI